MPQEQPGQEGQGDEVKNRAIKRVAVAVLIALAAAGGLTMLSHSNKPAPQAQQTVLPAEPAAVEQTASAVEPIAAEPQTASSVVETAPEHDAPPTTNAPPPPQVINPPQASEAPHKAAKALSTKPGQETLRSAVDHGKPAMEKVLG